MGVAGRQAKVGRAKHQSLMTLAYPVNGPSAVYKSDYLYLYRLNKNTNVSIGMKHFYTRRKFSKIKQTNGLPGLSMSIPLVDRVIVVPAT